MESINQIFVLLWLVWSICLASLALSFKTCKTHIPLKTLTFGGVVFSALILISNVWCAYHTTHIFSNFLVESIVTCAILCALDFACTIRTLRFLLPRTLCPNEIYIFEPQAFGYAGKPKNYKLYLRGKVMRGKQSFEVFFLSDKTWEECPSIKEPTLSLYEKVGIYLTDQQKRQLKNNKLELYVLMDDYAYFETLDGPSVKIFEPVY